MNDTYHLTQENVALRPSSIIEGAFVVDLHDNPYYDSIRVVGAGMLMHDYAGGFIPYDWTHSVEALSEHSMTMPEAIIALCQHLSPYTFTS